MSNTLVRLRDSVLFVRNRLVRIQSAAVRRPTGALRINTATLHTQSTAFRIQSTALFVGTRRQLFQIETALRQFFTDLGQRRIGGGRIRAGAKLANVMLYFFCLTKSSATMSELT